MQSKGMFFYELQIEGLSGVKLGLGMVLSRGENNNFQNGVYTKIHTHLHVLLERKPSTPVGVEGLIKTQLRPTLESFGAGLEN